MPKENKSRYSVLGMLSIRPGSGYDIKKFMESSTGYFWNESYGQIYPLLKELEAEGLATSHTEKHEGKPERYVYEITEAGRGALQHWLSEPVEQSVERNELLLKLFFGRQSALSVNRVHVQVYRALQEHLLKNYQAIEATLRQEQRVYALFTVRHGIHRCQALLAWCDETLETLDTLAETAERN